MRLLVIKILHSVVLGDNKAFKNKSPELLPGSKVRKM